MCIAWCRLASVTCCEVFQGQEVKMEDDAATRCCGCSIAALCWIVPTLLVLILVVVTLCALKTFDVIG
jgi:hypothetical protein